MRTSPAALAALATLAVVTSVGPSSRAAEDAPAPRETHWYGGQNLVVDGIALGFVAGGVAFAERSDRSNDGVAAGMLIAGTLGWLTFSPIVHLAHRRPGAALGSFGLRTLPILFLLPTLVPRSCNESTDSCGGDSSTGPLLVAAVVGALVIATDDGALAREDVAEANEPSAGPTVSIARSPNGRSSTPTFGFAGVF